MRRQGDVVTIRSWRIAGQSPGDFVEVSETAMGDEVTVASGREDTVLRVWLSKQAWEALTDLRYKGPNVTPREGQEAGSE